LNVHLVNPGDNAFGTAVITPRWLFVLAAPLFTGTGISTDSARKKKAKRWARWMAGQCKKLFEARPMPELKSPAWQPTPAMASFAEIDFPRTMPPFIVLPEEE
jgi:hypothetical protein